MNLSRLISLIVAPVFLVPVVLSCASSQAEAQWLPDRNYTEGPGIRVGDLELHPGVAFRGGYDTNVFRSKDNLVGSGILALTPHLNIRTLSLQRRRGGEEAAGADAESAKLPPPIAFNAGLAGTLFYYTDDRPPRNVELDTDVGLSVLPERAFGFDVGIAYVRNTRPFTAYGGSNDRNFYAQDRIKPTLTLRAESRSSVLKGSLTYTPLVQLFENKAFSYLNNAGHELTGRASWKFLPYTALIYDGSLFFTRYTDPTDVTAVVRLSDSDRLQTRIGLNGAVTPHFSVRALAGYAYGNYDNSQLNDYENVVGEAAVTYEYGASKLEGGYIRTVVPSALGGWAQEDRGYVSATTLIAKVVALTLTAGAAKAHYGRILDENGDPLGINSKTGDRTSKRNDTRYDAGLNAEYRVTNWLALLGDFSVSNVRTNFQFDTNSPFPYPGQFLTVQAYGGLRVHY